MGSWDVCLVLKARHSPQAWGSAPRFMVPETLALKARFISDAIEARLQRFVIGDLNSWGNVSQASMRQRHWR